jgi:hypothetical protein
LLDLISREEEGEMGMGMMGWKGVLCDCAVKKWWWADNEKGE